MKETSNHEWDVDLNAMTCVHKQSHVKVQFSLKDDIYITGEIAQVPPDLQRLWDKYNEFCAMSEKNIAEAKEAFMEQFNNKEMPHKININLADSLFPPLRKKNRPDAFTKLVSGS